MSVWGVVVAAGAGSRFGGAKHVERLGDRAAWEHARDALLAGGCVSVVVVGDVPGGIPGGARRRDSVAAGLAAVPPEAEAVLVHDAARPVAGPDLVRRLIARLQAGDVAAVVPLVPVVDTIKIVEGDRVQATPPRSELMAAQTPQAFKADILRRAHELDGDASDDASLVERLGEPVAWIEGDPENIKITYADDIDRARRLLGLR